MSMREEFEAWVNSQCSGADLRPMGDNDESYVNGYVREQWMGWKGSRETLVIELPPIDDPDCGPRVSFHLGAYKGQCREAIHAAGIKTK